MSAPLELERGRVALKTGESDGEPCVLLTVGNAAPVVIGKGEARWLFATAGPSVLIAIGAVPPTRRQPPRPDRG